MKKITLLLTVLALCAGAWAADNAVVDRQSIVHSPSSIVNGVDAITIPQMMSYQGKLTDTAGAPVEDTTYSVTFRLYTVPTGGSSFWYETQVVRTRGGLFSTLLGSVTPIGSMPDAGAAYLGMAVAGEAEMTPRLRLASSSYAYLSARAANADLLQGKDTTALDGRYVNEGQANAVTGAMLVDGTVKTADIGDTSVTMAKLARAGATTGQVVKWTGSAWAPRNDSVGQGGTADNAWVRVGGDSVLYTIRQLGIARGGAGNILYGNRCQTHTNLGVSCTTGTSGQNYSYATVGGGGNNAATNFYATVGGGQQNTASAQSATVAGGQTNHASGDYATVGGGQGNTATGSRATVAGGSYNDATESYATVGGGDFNNASAQSATVAGGRQNTALDQYATVGGGYQNIASGQQATIGGGASNAASAWYATIGGGTDNTASGRHAVIAGGLFNAATEMYAVVGGGANDTASGTFAAVGGGDNNTASGQSATVAGGHYNTATGTAATVGGGWTSRASGGYATVGGGRENAASGDYATVAGGAFDTSATLSSFTTNYNSVVPSGFNNSAAFNGQRATASNQTRVSALSKASGTFTIDHPLDPSGKILNHYFIEGPEMLNIYRGSAVLDGSGRAVVTLPDYFDALNRNPQVVLTGIGNSDVYLVEEVSGNRFTIGGKPGTKVNWIATGERQDVSAEITRRLMPVEQPKTGVLAGTMLDDDFLRGAMDQLVREGKAQGIDFRTAGGRQSYEKMKQSAEQK
jgi:hypothetical protein